MRISKTQNGVTTKYYWDRNYISNESVDGSFTASNYIGVNGIFARESGDDTDYYFKNGHGDVTSIVRDGEEMCIRDRYMRGAIITTDKLERVKV